MRKTLSILVLLLATTFCASAQYSGPRLFWDIPDFYAYTPDASALSDRVGIGAGTAFNVATYWGTARAGGGSTFTLEPNAEDVGDSFFATPYLFIEGGLGIYRSNGNRCAKSHQGAFTAMALAGLRQDFDTRSLSPADEADRYGFNWVLGAELGYFFIRDVFQNTEFVLRGTYYPTPQVLALQFGFKHFLNVREMGRY